MTRLRNASTAACGPGGERSSIRVDDEGRTGEDVARPSLDLS